MTLQNEADFWYEMATACAEFKEWEQMEICDRKCHAAYAKMENLKIQQIIERVKPSKLWHVNWDNGRYNLLRGVKEYEAFMAKRKRARTNPIKFTTITELQVGEHYSCDQCQDYVTYPHKCMAFLDYM